MQLAQDAPALDVAQEGRAILSARQHRGRVRVHVQRGQPCTQPTAGTHQAPAHFTTRIDRGLSTLSWCPRQQESHGSERLRSALSQGLPLSRSDLSLHEEVVESIAPTVWKWAPWMVPEHAPVLGSHTRSVASFSPPPVTTVLPSGQTDRSAPPPSAR